MKATQLILLLVVLFSCTYSKSPKLSNSPKQRPASIHPLHSSDGVVHEVEKAAKAVYDLVIFSVTSKSPKDFCGIFARSRATCHDD